MQTAIGDPMAGLTEEERAGGLDKHAQAATGSTQTFRPVVLDLDGNGIETVGRDLSGVAFNVDDSGYLKSTAWVSGNDAFLTLDRSKTVIETNRGNEAANEPMYFCERIAA
jgi:hypothetical protein